MNWSYAGHFEYERRTLTEEILRPRGYVVGAGIRLDLLIIFVVFYCILYYFYVVICNHFCFCLDLSRFIFQLLVDYSNNC